MLSFLSKGKKSFVYLILWNCGCYIYQGKQMLIYPCGVSVGCRRNPKVVGMKHIYALINF